MRVDKLGVLLAAILLPAMAMPLATYRANRIAMGESRDFFESLPLVWASLLLVSLLITAITAVLMKRPLFRLLVAGASLLIVFLAMGEAGRHLLTDAASYARVSPGAGFWVMLFGLMLMITDAVVRLKPAPLMRLLLLVVALLALILLLAGGQWDGLSIMAEYRNRADGFWREVSHHLQLALGSLLIAIGVGIPFGVLIQRYESLRVPVLNILSLIQTIPSMALFGMLIVPLGWVALNVPGARTLGIQGVGIAPAFVALFLYSLLPMVANTVAGLAGVPAATREAAAAMGMKPHQQLFAVELPLALPVIMTGVRIVLVQNIGLATIAALIGGGGLGTFVFQGLGQTATDLILLGALPTVILAFVAAAFLDVFIDLSRGARA